MPGPGGWFCSALGPVGPVALGPIGFGREAQAAIEAAAAAISASRRMRRVSKLISYSLNRGLMAQLKRTSILPSGSTDRDCKPQRDFRFWSQRGATTSQFLLVKERRPCRIGRGQRIGRLADQLAGEVD